MTGLFMPVAATPLLKQISRNPKLKTEYHVGLTVNFTLHPM
jgi:uncharacterized membrane protein